MITLTQSQVELLAFAVDQAQQWVDYVRDVAKLNSADTTVADQGDAVLRDARKALGATMIDWRKSRHARA